MISALAPENSQTPLYLTFLNALENVGFSGDIASDYGNRTVMSTDNSIYQRLPQAVLYPRDVDDLCHIAKLADEERFRAVNLAPRGGGTGTNAQSLTDGLVVDVSRHMNRIIDIDVDNRRVRVQAGVVRDQLNAALEPFGLFFAPDLSTSNRATLGGMISTDASGQGSCQYGKTRDHVLDLEIILLGGARMGGETLDEAALDVVCERADRIGAAYRITRNIASSKADLIKEVFPPLTRCLTGYDLAHLHSNDGAFDIKSVLCGSEGTLGFISEATLNVVPIPEYITVVNVRYKAFMDALRDAPALMNHKPTAIETVDSTVLNLAKNDIVWNDVEQFFPDGGETFHGINLVEFSDDDQDRLNQCVDDFCDYLRRDNPIENSGYTVAEGRDEVSRIYEMRKRAVGLLGNVQGEKRPIPFVEDTAVPPESLADYIDEFRQALDSRGLQYGMFGHVDAGVLHVRPAIDMRDPRQAAMIRPLTDEVVALTRKYGGLLWGEHGKGIRSEFVPEFFGPLYPELQRIKAAFDPHNQLNPGKIATPSLDQTESGKGARNQVDLLRIDEISTRGERDREIKPKVWQQFPSAVHCNGNGACFNYDPNDAMCPSWKATRSRIHSPKGRAALMREWLRLQGNAGVNVHDETRRKAGEGAWAYTRRFLPRLMNTIGKHRSQPDFSHEVYDAMAGCLACKACAAQCPVKVDVPTFRAQFLNLYHGRYLRPPRDWLIGNLEFLLPWARPLAPVYNHLISIGIIRTLVARLIGIVDPPRLSRKSLRQPFRSGNIELATPEVLGELSESQKVQSVILVQDAFTSFFEMGLIHRLVDLLVRLDIRVFITPYSANGKPLQVQGFMKRFEHTAQRQATRLNRLAEFGVPLVGAEPAMTLVYRQEYVKALGQQVPPKVLLLQEWLLAIRSEIKPPELAESDKAHFKLLVHCTERTNAPKAAQAWVDVYAHFGLELEIMPTGCCGMSGTYGHEARNRRTSEVIYNQSWRPIVEEEQNSVILATGYSCRSQAKRLSGRVLMHPAEGLLVALLGWDMPR